MSKISEKNRNIMEKAIYLPMLLTIFKRDLIVIQKSPFKLKQPYLQLIEETMNFIQAELADVKHYMDTNNLKVQEVKRDEAFTMFLFLQNENKEKHNYFNPRIRNKVQELMEFYLFERHSLNKFNQLGFSDAKSMQVQKLP